MKELFAWVKANAKDGANLAEFEDMLERSTVPENQAEALEFIKRTPSLRSALDAEKNREYDRAVDKFKSEKLPDIEKALREQVIKELNPQETPEQKRIRELEEKLGAKEKAEIISVKKTALMEKAKELGLDPMIGADYALYGDDAETVMKKHADYIKSREDALKTELAKDKFGGKSPVAGGDPMKKAIKDMSPDEAMAYAKQGPQQLAEVRAAQRAK